MHRLKEKYPEVVARLEARTAAAAEGRAARGVPEEASGSEAASSEDDDDDNGDIPDKTEAQIFETLLRIRRRDSSIYDRQARFYSSSSDDEEGGKQSAQGEAHRRKLALLDLRHLLVPGSGGLPAVELDLRAGGGTCLPGISVHPAQSCLLTAWQRPCCASAGSGGAAKLGRPLYLKDLQYRQAMEGGRASSEEEGEEGQERRPAAGVPAYDQEQRDLKRAFLQAFEQEVGGEEGAVGERETEGAGEFGGGVLHQRKRARGDGEQDGGAGRRGASGQQVAELLDGYFGRDEELGDADRFLKHYILNKVRAERPGTTSSTRLAGRG